MHGNAILRVTVSRLGVYALVTATGSIELGTDQIMAENLDRALALADTAVIIDLSEVEFCDSTGLSAFAAAARQARARRLTLVACGLADRVHRVFTITRLNQAIHLQPDVETAVRWLENGTSHITPPPSPAHEP